MISSKICRECALSKQYTWPEGHIGTINTGFCDYCNQSKEIYPLSDWRALGVSERQITPRAYILNDECVERINKKLKENECNT
jgi:hypothetical protein